MNSFNHYSLGSCGEWMFSTLAGIDTDGPGFRKPVIRPTPGEGISWVKASYNSINGRIVSNWKIEGDQLTMDVTVPVNTTAAVSVPAKDASTVTESGKPAGKAAGVKFLHRENGCAIYELQVPPLSPTARLRPNSGASISRTRRASTSRRRGCRGSWRPRRRQGG